MMVVDNNLNIIFRNSSINHRGRKKINVSLEKKIFNYKKKIIL